MMIERFGILIGVLKAKINSRFVAPGLVSALVIFTSVILDGKRVGSEDILKIP